MSLGIGSEGQEVIALQMALNSLRAGLLEDGIYGPITRRAVLNFQRAHGLHPDGKAGPATLDRLVLCTGNISDPSKLATLEVPGILPKPQAMALLNDKAMRAEIRHGAIKALPNTGLRCAATLSLWMRQFHVFGPGQMFARTSDLIAALPDWPRVTSIRDVEPLDILVSTDKNGNGVPDHVGIIFSKADSQGRVIFIDNQNHGNPYTRNLGPGPKTPMQYAIRVPWPAK